MSKSELRTFVYLPIALAVAVSFGMFLGEDLQPVKSGKLETLFGFIEREYVDSVSRRDLEESAIQDILQGLDPHSSYIPASDLQQVNEQLQGNFEGIGIEFNILNDTLIVVTPISGGPSDRLGIKSGDRIVKIDGELVAGTGITNDDVRKSLRGKRGTKVDVSILRKGKTELLDFTITRGTIPITSVDVYYMIDEEIGYIKINRFSANTNDEYLEAFYTLKEQGLNKLILDLRGNPGGFLTAATNLADEFLESGDLIVYTEGKSRERDSYYASKRGAFQDEKLVVLIDEGSASASEIVAGAVQDHDRATVIGRRSFGKGLVQEQRSIFSDSSAIRLTIARYYTPTGRCIQKPYDQGSNDYYNDILHRIQNGELASSDSIEFADSLKFTTPGGKTVYGGGGIMPDIFIPVDTTGYSPYLDQILNTSTIYDYALEYVDENRTKLEKFESASDFVKDFEVKSTLLNQFFEYADTLGISREDLALSKESQHVLELRLKAFIGRHMWGNEGLYPVLHKIDNTVQRSIQELRKS